LPASTENTGTYFLLPPHHRLFAVIDDAAAGTEVARELRSEGATDDVWTFFGEEGIKSLEPEILHHGLPVAVVRVVQRLLTSDCEYCDGLCSALKRGAMVLAVRVPKDDVGTMTERLARRGAHSFAYGEHWNFLPVAGAGHTVGSSTEVDEA
jgi:hypothetical protein